MQSDRHRRASKKLGAALVWPALLALAMSAGCSGAPDEIPSALAAAPPPRQVSYKLEIEPAAARLLIEVRRPAADPFAFRVPPTWVTSGDLTPTAETADGRDLELEATPETWSVAGAGEATFIMTVPLAGRADMAPAADESPLAPVIGEELFFGAGSSIFPVPAAPDDLENVQAEVVTKDGQWPVWTSWGRRDTSFRHVDDLSKSVILAGAWKVSAREADDTLLQVAATPKYEGSPSGLRSLLAKVVQLQTEMFGRYDRNSLLLVVSPSGAGDVTPVAVGDALLVFPPDDPTEAQLAETLARTHYQQWVGGVFERRIHGADASWFPRATREYYALRSAMALGYLDDAQVVARLNDTIDRYYAQPAEISNPSRECLLALLIDIEIRADSGGLKSLDHFVRKLAFRLGPDGSELPTGALQSELETFTGRPWGEFFATYVIGNTRLPLTRLDRAGLIMTQQSQTAYSLAFTYEGDHLQNATVATVSDRGPAKKAGLQAGDVIKKVKMSSEADSAILIEVQRPGQDKPITAEYVPKEELEVPRVTEMTDLFRDWFMP